MARLEDLTLVDVLRRRADEKPDMEAFVFVDRFYDRIALTRKDLWEKSKKFAAILKRYGLGKGDVVCNTLVNSPERLITMYGTLAAGAILMNAQQLLASGEDFFHHLHTSECQAVIVDTGKPGDALEFLNRISYEDESAHAIRYEGLPYLKTVVQLRVYSEDERDPSSRWLCELDQETDTFEEKDVQEDDVVALFNTSGSTGLPKLVPHTNPRMLFKGTGRSDIWGTQEQHVFYINRPLGGFGGFPHMYSTVGCKTVIPNLARGKPEDVPAHMVRVFEEEKCDFANLAGVEVERILEKLGGEPMSHPFKRVTIGGGPLATYIKTAIGKVTEKIIVVYGGTEFGAASAMLLEDNSTYESYCAGKLFDWVRMKILDANSQPVQTGQQGEIYIRSTCSGDRYWNDADKTRESFLEDGWYRTGDLGYQDTDGYLFVLGRTANAIMKGCYHVNPGWLEAKILTCPGIESLAIIGVPDPVLFEDICLCVVKTPDSTLTQEAVKEFCRKLFLTSETETFTPVPKYFLFFDAFPYNPNLKINRVDLKAEACKRLGIEVRARETDPK